MIRIAINGFGRIGRNVVRALYEGQHRDNFKVVAINDLGEPHINAHLLQYDTAHGRFGQAVSVEGDDILIAGDSVRVLAERDPAALPWRELNIDVVFECTGLFTHRLDAQKHIDAGAKKVVISAPGKEVDATIVYGVNDSLLAASHQIVSNASVS